MWFWYHVFIVIFVHKSLQSMKGFRLWYILGQKNKLFVKRLDFCLSGSCQWTKHRSHQFM
jgi:hypothetical protein